MSDDPFFPPNPRLMDPAIARDIARGHKALAELYERAGDRTRANRELQDSQWWLTYALTLSQTRDFPPSHGAP